MRELLGAALLLLAVAGSAAAGGVAADSPTVDSPTVDSPTAGGPATDGPATDGPPVTIAELSQIRAAIIPCWHERRPGERAAGQVAIKVCLGQDGMVESTEILKKASPADAWHAEMEQRARRALLRCQPYPMPAGGPRPYCLTAAFQLPPH